MNKNYILKEIKKANKHAISVFNYLYKLNIEELNEIVWRLTEINEILTNLEIEMENTNEK